MGWTVYRESKSLEGALEEMRRLHDWTSEDGTRYTVLADGITGHGEDRGYYAAVQIDAPGKPLETYCGVSLITLCPFGHKDMGESMGPYIHNAPLEVLQALLPLPARAPVVCSTCDGTGKLGGPNVRQERHGEPCYACDGTGERDWNDNAREWRKKAWARYGGEPQGFQMSLLPTMATDSIGAAA